MKILGISEIDNDAGAALLVDGRVLYAVNEERFSRVKRHKGFPYRSIKWLLCMSGYSLDEIDRIAIAKFTTKKDMKEYMGSLKSYIKGDEQKSARVLLDKAIWCFRNLPRHLGLVVGLNHQLKNWIKKNKIPKKKVFRVQHHPAHSACAYYFSGFKNALVVTCDGQGLGLTATISEASDNKIKEINRVLLPNSAGAFYALVTKACGFKPNLHEGKITGLAAYGNEIPKLKSFVNKLLEFKNGRIVGNAIYANYLKVKKLCKKYGKDKLAFAFQKRLEEVICQYVRYYWGSRKHLKNIALAGGVFANVKLNQKIKEIDCVEKIFIFPHMADGGLSVGAAALVEPNMGVTRLDNLYLGPSFNEEKIKETLDKQRINYTRPKNLSKRIADLIHKGKVVARFNGNMEFGPRALGNRSILYHTKDPTVNNWLNKKLDRSEFMPFAPVTLRKKAKECYKNFQGNEYAAEFMTITLDCTDWMKKNSPAVVHKDSTARPQVINKHINPEFYSVVKEYYNLTGIPSIINTSFNIHEEPIVCTPYDAIRAFRKGRLDALAIGPFLVSNKNATKE